MSDLERVTALVVEDNIQVRNLVAGVLRQVGVGNILRANNGMEAIELLREIRLNPARIGVSEVDIIIADWHMDPVNGGTLLRWIRRHRDSPDKMLPFFMLTGDCGEDMVKTARDLGVSEFIAKPFRIDQFIEHIEGAVKDDRRFVAAPGYFGPDRRRRREAFEGEDKRGTAKNTAKFFEPPRRLFYKSGGNLQVTPDRITAAAEEVEGLQADFIELASEDLAKLQAIYDQAKAEQSEEARAAIVQTMAPICHELRGQGGVFGYMLISVVADSLHLIVSSILAVPNDALGLLRTHLDLLRAILREDIKGDGGALGPELMESLHHANVSFVDKKENEKLVTREFIDKAKLGTAMFGTAARQMMAMRSMEATASAGTQDTAADSLPSPEAEAEPARRTASAG